MILSIHNTDPGTPLDSSYPEAQRYQIGAVWVDSTSDLQATTAELAAWELARQPTYRELRAAEFNRKSPGEQFAMMYDDLKNQTTTWVDWQTEIKVRIAK